MTQTSFLDRNPKSDTDPQRAPENEDEITIFMRTLNFSCGKMETVFDSIEIAEQKMLDARILYDRALYKEKEEDEGLVEYGLRNTAILFMISNVMRSISPNIPYKQEDLLADIIKRLGEHPRPTPLVRFICERYLLSADALAYKHLLLKARYLVPREEQRTIKAMVKGRSVKVSGRYYDEIWPGETHVSYETEHALDALEALIKVAILNESSRHATGGILRKVLNKQPFGRIAVDQFEIVSFRPRKNWSMDIEMSDTAKAFRVAELLMECHAAKS